MFRMYYLSTAVEGLITSDHEDILKSARKNNKALDITGLLVVKGKFFVQALEGEKETVMELFEKIQQDERHLRVAVLSKEDVDQRLFSNWEMGFRDISLSEQFSEVDLSDPKYVNEPELLNKAFRLIVEDQKHQHV